MISNNKIDLDSVRVVCTIVDEGSFARAASALHRVPSTISYTVSKIEGLLDIQIFNRSGNKISLTEAGSEFYAHGMELLRVARETERALERLASGWESQLHIVVHDVLPVDQIIKLVGEFYAVAPSTRLKVSTEVLAGAWDALLSDRADFVIAVGNNIPDTGGISVVDAGQVEFLFCVSPDHPLADYPEPIPEDVIRRYRAIAIADTARSLPKRSVAVLPGQQVLTVNSPEMKLEAHLQGLGVGTMPKYMVAEYLESGRLVKKTTESGASWVYPLVYAWKNKHQGKGITWLRRRLCEEGVEWFK